MRKSYRGNLGVSLRYIYYFQSSNSFPALIVPEVDLFLGPGDIMVVILILDKILDVSLMPDIVRNFFNSKL